MENEPTPEEPNRERHPESVRYACPECGLEQWMSEQNTIVFIAPEDEELYIYVKCESGECDALTYPIDYDHADDFAYLDDKNWYTRDGQGRPTPVIEIKPPEPTWDEVTLAEIQYADPYEYSTRYLYKDARGEL